VPGVFTPVLAQHSNVLTDRFALQWAWIGYFATSTPFASRSRLGSDLKLPDVTAKVVIYEMLVEGKRGSICET
jgi:hypothetical protein